MSQSLNDSIPSVIRAFHEPGSFQQIVHQAVEGDAVCVLQGVVL